MDNNMLYVVLPCYNEESNISNLIDAWKAQEKNLQSRNILLKLIVVDDGSTDDTPNIVKSNAFMHDNITLLIHKKNSGLGYALNTGINYVLSLNKDGFLCIMDGDMTQDPVYIHPMMDKLLGQNLECVIASRYQRGSRVEGLSFYRKFLSQGARLLYTLRFRIPNVRDFTCGYRLYKLGGLNKLSKKYGSHILGEKSFACMTELLVKVAREGLGIGEVPFVLRYQLKSGESKMRVFKTIARSLVMMAKL